MLPITGDILKQYETVLKKLAIPISRDADFHL